MASRIVEGVVDVGAYEHSLATPVQFVAGACKRVAEGPFQLSFTGGTNAAYDIWASTNLEQWFWLGTASSAAAGVFEYVDSAASNSPHRFYRAATRQYE